MTTPATIRVAAQYLAARAEFVKNYDAEPAVNDDGDPYDPEAWVAWYENGTPVRDRFRAATDRFAAVLGTTDKHPFTLEPAARELTNRGATL